MRTLKLTNNKGIISAYINDEEIREMISATIKIKFNNGEVRDVNIKHIDFRDLLGICKED